MQIDNAVVIFGYNELVIAANAGTGIQLLFVFKFLAISFVMHKAKVFPVEHRVVFAVKRKIRINGLTE